MIGVIERIEAGLASDTPSRVEWRALLELALTEIKEISHHHDEFVVAATIRMTDQNAEIARARQTAAAAEDRRRHLEDVSCRQQNEIKRLKTRITNLWYALDRVKHGAEYCDTLGDIINGALKAGTDE